MNDDRFLRHLSAHMNLLEQTVPHSVPVETARELIAQLGEPIAQTESCPIELAADRILATDLYSPIDVPAHDNAAMDGFSMRAIDLNPLESTRLRIVGSALAGRPFNGLPAIGESIRIMTGAVIPQGHDTVVMHEICDLDEGVVTIPGGQRPGQNRRLQGEDLARGQLALRAGTLLEPAHIGLIASLGLDRIEVRRRLRVALLSTGDELRSPGESLGSGQIYDSNRYTLTALLRRLGVQVIDLGRIPDQPDRLETTMRDAASEADVILSSAGVSAGDADYVKATLARLGRIVFWTLAMRPGRPLALGHIGSTLYFGLPGNPVAVMVTFMMIIRDALLRRAGLTLRAPLRIDAYSLEPIKKRPGRSEFLRGYWVQGPDGRLGVRTTGDQGSGILRSMAEADCLIVLPADRETVAEGEQIQCIPMSALLNP